MWIHTQDFFSCLTWVSDWGCNLASDFSAESTPVTTCVEPKLLLLGWLVGVKVDVLFEFCVLVCGSFFFMKLNPPVFFVFC